MIVFANFFTLAGKFAGAIISAYVTRLEAPLAIASGLMAKGVAEIALLLVMLHGHVIDEALFSLLVVIMFGYILLTPMGISLALKRARHMEDIEGGAAQLHLLERFVLGEVQVRNVIDQTRIYPEHTITVRNFVDHWTTPEQHDYVVVNEGQLAGVVSISLLRYLPRTQWPHTSLQEALRHNTPVAGPDEQVEDVLQRMIENALTVLPVVNPDTGQFLGSISSYEILEIVLLNASGRDI